ncbi:MAG: hypothetical protein ACOC2E_02590, partial [Bacteroidota bacterium]
SIILFLLVILRTSDLFAQSEKPFQLQKVSVHKQVKGFQGIDDLGNIYALSDGVLYKYKQDMKQERTFAEKKYGDISTVFFDDPMNLIIFFEQTGMIVFLDNYLTVKKVIQPSDLKENDWPQKISFSSQNGFWTYFPVEAELIRFDKNLHVQAQSGNLNFASPGLQKINQLKESDQKLFVEDRQLWVFDLFANFLFKIEKEVPDQFFVNEKQIFFIDDNYLVVYDYINRTENVFLLPESDVRNYFWKKPFLFLNTQSALVKYRLISIH